MFVKPSTLYRLESGGCGSGAARSEACCAVMTVAFIGFAVDLDSGAPVGRTFVSAFR